jgi:hypothetical protein
MFSKRSWYELVIFGSGALALLAGCGGDDTSSGGPALGGSGGGTSGCTYTGIPETCYCPNGQTAQYMCQQDGTYTTCPCSTVGGMGGAGMGGAGAGGGAGTTPAAVCGNNAIDPGEQCDGQILLGQTCQTQGYLGGGTLLCNPSTCTYDVSQCLNLMDAGTTDGGP